MKAAEAHAAEWQDAMESMRRERKQQEKERLDQQDALDKLVCSRNLLHSFLVFSLLSLLSLQTHERRSWREKAEKAEAIARGYSTEKQNVCVLMFSSLPLYLNPLPAPCHRCSTRLLLSGADWKRCRVSERRQS